jgi:hypothetical protein
MEREHFGHFTVWADDEDGDELELFVGASWNVDSDGEPVDVVLDEAFLHVFTGPITSSPRYDVVDFDVAELPEDAFEKVREKISDPDPGPAFLRSVAVGVRGRGGRP